MAIDVPPARLLRKNGFLWEPPAWCADLFVCPEHGREYERAAHYWCCPATLSCKAIPDGLLLDRLRARAREVGVRRPKPETVFYRARQRSRWLWGGKGRERWRQPPRTPDPSMCSPTTASGTPTRP